MDKLKHYKNMILSNLSLEEWYLRRCDFLVNYHESFNEDEHALDNAIKLRNLLQISETLKDKDKNFITKLANQELDNFAKNILLEEESDLDKKIISYDFSSGITTKAHRDVILSEFFLKTKVAKFIITNHLDLFEFIESEYKIPVSFDKYTTKELYYDVFLDEKTYRRFLIYPEFLEDFKRRYIN